MVPGGLHGRLRPLDLDKALCAYGLVAASGKVDVSGVDLVPGVNVESTSSEEKYQIQTKKLSRTRKQMGHSTAFRNSSWADTWYAAGTEARLEEPTPPFFGRRCLGRVAEVVER